MEMSQGRVRVKKFCIDDEDDREECEQILTKYNPLGRVMRQSEVFTKDGVLFVHLQWLEDVENAPFRE